MVSQFHDEIRNIIHLDVGYYDRCIDIEIVE